MAEKRIGISRDLIIHPGETIADILEERGITQAELSTRAGVSPAYISNVIAGKKNISSKFAMALEYALGVPKSFWLNLQANYDAALLELNEEDTVTDDERKALSGLTAVVKYLRRCKMLPEKQSKNDTILTIRKIFHISNISNLAAITPTGAFRVSSKAHIDPLVMGAWIRLCEMLGDRKPHVHTQFSADRVNELTQNLKAVMVSQSAELQKDIADVLSSYGIKFSMVKNFRGAPVHGYISLGRDGSYHMVLTIRGAYADIFWFSLFHEIGHIVNGDISKVGVYIDTIEGNDEAKENAADMFARDALLNATDYKLFVARGDYSIGTIESFARTQRVAPYVIIGRLQKEERISYAMYNDYKLRYKWADA